MSPLDNPRNMTGSGSGMPEIDVEQLKADLDSGADFDLIDVREPVEHQICHLPQATLIPMREIPGRLSQFDPNRRYAVVCKVGGRSAMVVAAMRQAGLNATNVAGGMRAWAQRIDPDMPIY
jgi:adenylyltransferase/sulfurtransferase